MSELSRRFRWWCYFEDRYPFTRCWLRRKLADLFLSYAWWRTHSNPNLCWANAAMWAMGFDHPLLMPVVPGCDWCGKCQKTQSLDKQA